MAEKDNKMKCLVLLLLALSLPVSAYMMPAGQQNCYSPVEMAALFSKPKGKKKKGKSLKKLIKERLALEREVKHLDKRLSDISDDLADSLKGSAKKTGKMALKIEEYMNNGYSGWECGKGSRESSGSARLFPPGFDGLEELVSENQWQKTKPYRLSGFTGFDKTLVFDASSVALTFQSYPTFGSIFWVLFLQSPEANALEPQQLGRAILFDSDTRNYCETQRGGVFKKIGGTRYCCTQGEWVDGNCDGRTQKPVAPPVQKDCSRGDNIADENCLCRGLLADDGNGICQVKCPSGERTADGRRCKPPKQVKCEKSGGRWAGGTCKCSTAEGKKEQGGVCVSDVKRDCSRGDNIADENCLCRGLLADDGNGICQVKCPSGERTADGRRCKPPKQVKCEKSGGRWAGGTCKCSTAEGKKEQGGVCVSDVKRDCSRGDNIADENCLCRGLLADDGNGICQVKCPSGERTADGRRCKPPKQVKCEKSGGRWAGGTCKCSTAEGKKEQGGVCVDVKRDCSRGDNIADENCLCRGLLADDGNGICQVKCPSGERTADGRRCKPPKQVKCEKSGGRWAGGTCKCSTAEGKKEQGGVCVDVKRDCSRGDNIADENCLCRGLLADDGNGICQVKCPSGERTADGRRCKPPKQVKCEKSGGRWAGGTCKCSTAEGKKEQGGVCVDVKRDCSRGDNIADENCLCRGLLADDGNGICQVKCPSGERTADGKRCKSPRQVKCEKSNTWKNGKCVCVEGKAISGGCACPEGFNTRWKNPRDNKKYCKKPCPRTKSHRKPNGECVKCRKGNNKPWQDDEAFGPNGRVNPSFCDEYARDIAACKKALKKMKDALKNLKSAQDRLADKEDDISNKQIALSSGSGEEKTESDGPCYQCLRDLWAVNRKLSGSQIFGHMASIGLGVFGSWQGFEGARRHGNRHNELLSYQGYPSEDNFGWSLAGGTMGLPYVFKGINGLAQGNAARGSFACSPTVDPYSHYYNRGPANQYPMMMY